MISSEPEHEIIERQITKRLMSDPEALSGGVSLEVLVHRAVREEAPLLGRQASSELTRRILANVSGLGPLEEMLEDTNVSDILINGPGPVWIERRGCLEQTEVELDEASIMQFVERMIGPLGRRVDRCSPIVDARLPDGSRVNVVVSPLAVDGPAVSIRRFGSRQLSLSEFCSGSVCDLLVSAVRERRNIVVFGGTGAGKTTLLNALARAIPPTERVITIEDTAELKLGLPNMVRLEVRHENSEGVGSVTTRELLRTALRMRPDRIVVGEVRGSETLDMLMAMNTGHSGSLSTCHANGPDDALRRLETMTLLGDTDLPLSAIRSQLGSAVDLLVGVQRCPDGKRLVTSVSVVDETGGDVSASPLEK